MRAANFMKLQRQLMILSSTILVKFTFQLPGGSCGMRMIQRRIEDWQYINHLILIKKPFIFKGFCFFI